jgi:PIN domain nuclease of toxin-antitoxin system
MDLLLDTHAFIWWDTRNPSLGVSAAAAIADAENRIFVSAASVWEIAVKARLGRLAFTGSPSAAIGSNGFTSLPILPEQAEAAAALPDIHQDPFDRILIAQAIARRFVLVTADHKIRQYNLPVLWAR